MAKTETKELKIPPEDKKKLDQIIAASKGKEASLLTILESAQKMNKHKFLPVDVLEYISMKTTVPLSRIFNVVTFYSFFNLKPQGEHVITVCRGTACHTKGSKSLLDEIAVKMNCTAEMEGGEPTFTTPDNKYTIQTVACFGQCALAPVVAIDGMIHSNVTSAMLNKLLEKTGKSKRGKK